MTPQPPRVDIRLYIRPFRTDSWVGICIVLLVMLLCILAPYLIVKKVELTTGHQVLTNTKKFEKK